MVKQVMLCLRFFLPGCLRAQEWQWALTNEKPKMFYEPGSEAHDIAFDTQGNVYLTGHFNRSLSVGTTEMSGTTASQAFLLKYDACGNLLWSWQSRDMVCIQSWNVIVDRQGNAFLAGSVTGKVVFDQFTMDANGSSGFLAKFSPMEPLNG